MPTIPIYNIKTVPEAWLTQTETLIIVTESTLNTDVHQIMYYNIYSIMGTVMLCVCKFKDRYCDITEARECF